MPFQQPYTLGFTPGDLIYGLAPMRAKLVIHFGFTIQGPATVDQYRRSQMESEAYKKIDRTTWKSFLRENEAHSRYGRYSQFIRKYNSDEEEFADHSSSVEQNSAWRAKSKFGMEWTIKNGRGTIHFVLDGIDMAAVVTKTHLFTDVNGDVQAQDLPRGPSQGAEDKERTITHSELRWIYRNRTNPLVVASVQFWRTNPLTNNILPCEPPWINGPHTVVMPTSGAVKTWPQAWAIYKPKVERAIF